MEVLSSPLQQSGAMWCITRHPTNGGGGGRGARGPGSARTGAGGAKQQSVRPRRRGGAGFFTQSTWPRTFGRRRFGSFLRELRVAGVTAGLPGQR
jgi:hypothetical protein